MMPAGAPAVGDAAGYGAMIVEICYHVKKARY